MTEHVLKTLAPYWHAVERGDKTFDVRRDDRGFQRGDVLVLRRLNEERPHLFDCDYTSKSGCYDLRRRVLYVLTGGQLGIEPGYVVMALGPEEAEA
ncbi:MAG: DUF3850 domain-containing protein [Elusimicrobia bacterium]|nr:DUF3850 domain-containing protein [Elusimicrobiota bacterium]